MASPDVPIRMELTFELPGTPDQVWQAVASAGGISSWFVRTDLEEREGGRIVTHMGDTEMPGNVTGWDPPRRFAYEEPDWASLSGHEGADVTPLATEFLIEARSGGTCVLRVVSSAFGQGADWEQEFIDEMTAGWAPFFERLRLYLEHFSGQEAALLEVERVFEGTTRQAVLDAIRADLGIGGLGQTIEARGVTGEVAQVLDDSVLVRLTAPVPGFLGFASWDIGEGRANAMVQGQLFSPDAAAYVERESPAWRAWVENLPVGAASTAPSSP